MSQPIPMTLFSLMQSFVGEVHERAGERDDPFILWCLESVGYVDSHDEISWCSAGVNRMCKTLRLPRTRSAAARSWLTIGTPITLLQAEPAFDVVILKRGPKPQPGPEVIKAPGHVTLFAGMEGPGTVLGLGCNQSDGITVAPFNVLDVLGVRRLV